MTDAAKLKAIKKYLTSTRRKIEEAKDADSEYNTSTGNGVNCCEASAMFREVEEEIGAILTGD